MPIYEYLCAQCGVFDKLQKISEPVLTRCPVCNAPVRRLISSEVGIQFKGGGFYTTDAAAKKKELRKLNQERQKDNQALLDGDVKGYNQQAEATDKKIAEVKAP
jgi:putative FmdB family regulatory protein